MNTVEGRAAEEREWQPGDYDVFIDDSRIGVVQRKGAIAAQENAPSQPAGGATPKLPSC